MLITNARARQRLTRGFGLNLGVFGDAARRFDQRAGAGVLPFERVERLVVTRLFGEDVVSLGFASSAQGEDVEERKADRHAGRPVEGVRVPALGAVKRAVEARSRAPAEDGHLPVEAREV